MHRILFLLLCFPLVVRADSPPTYESDIRPILKAACFHCHGEEATVEGNLDLRLRKFIVKGGDSGPALVPDHPDKSLMLERIESGEMPPGETRLSTDKISRIRDWIASGARTLRPEPETIAADEFTPEERNFWSLQPIQRPTPPAVQQTTRVRTPIDSFILARLEQDQLGFAPDAEPHVLIRRLYFDLLGLPPTPEQVDAFLADDKPGAYERLVDRLLASPNYGERWGRHWLDVAGYADSEGFTEYDTERSSAFRYRDYVIRSFNADKPFDQFITEQLAGDELISGPLKNMSPESIEQLTATGFLRMAPDGTGDSGVEQDLARNQVMSETLKIVSTALMGLTVGCAECHNHRYDPIRQSDYYALRAIFEPALNWKAWRVPKARLVSLYTDEDRRIAAEIEAKAKVVDDERAELTKVFIDQTLESQLLKLPEPEEVRDRIRTAYKTESGKRTPEQKTLLNKYPKVLKISAGSLYLYDREIRTDAAKIDAERKRKQSEFIAEAFSQALATLPAQEQTALRAAHGTAAASRTQQQQELLSRHADKLVTAENLEEFNPEAAAELKRLQQAHTELLATLKADRIKALQEKATDIRNSKPHEGFVRALTEPHGELPQTFLFERGSFEQPREAVVPAGLSVLDQDRFISIPQNNEGLPTSGRRLAFAKRVTDGKYPLTPRVLVNRIWLHHFGRGIVDTPGDFGFLGARPTHPQLLDWLASEFVAGGWKLKSLHKHIVTSTVYRQSSQRSQRSNEIDPDNRLYSHASIRRLDAETVRDAILSISGKLNTKMFGPPVPVMEDIVGQIVIGRENLDGERKPLAAIDLQGEQFRRSLYIQVRRSRPLAVLATFDLPQMEPNCTERTSSTVTPQALMLMNSDFAAEYAGLFAERVRLLAEDDPGNQCRHAWQLAFGRPATDQQLKRSVDFLQSQQAHYEENRPAGSKQTSAQLALDSFCQALISSNRFLYVD